MTDPLRCGPITHQRQREDGSWEEIPGWCSIRDGVIHLDVLTTEEQRLMAAIGGPWR